MRLMIFVLLGLFFVSFASAITLDNCDDNMVAYWRMEDNVLDSFGPHNGVWEGLEKYEGLIVDKAAKFDGGSLISISGTGQVLDLHEGAFAIEFWMKAESESLTSYLLSKGNYQIKWVKEGSFPSYTRYIEATVTPKNGAPATVTSLPISDLTVGHYVVLTWHSSLQNLSLYVDNDLKASAGLANPGASSDALEIGQDFVGLIDEVALYNRSFDADDVDFHYKTSAGGWDYCHTAGAGDVSSTRTDFTLAGCALPDGSSISAGSCWKGMYYCGEVSLILYDTFGTNRSLPINGGCSMENPEYELGAGMRRCCPGGYVCNDDPDDDLGKVFVCNQNPVDCGRITDQGECDLAECFWIEEAGGICVANPLDYSCSIYKSNVSCNVDPWNVGAAGFGTEVCGTYFVVELSPDGKQGYVVPMDSCKCNWNSTTETEGDYCVLEYDELPNIYGTIANTFRCQKDFDVGECIDGLQQITWDAGPINPTGEWEVPGDIPPEVLEAAKCTPDDVGISRSCGEPIIKLPGFSLFALISSLGIIGLVYFLKRE